MSEPKTTALTTINARAYEGDMELLDRVAALAKLYHWEGEWNSRPAALHSLLPLFISTLPEADQRVLFSAEAKAD